MMALSEIKRISDQAAKSAAISKKEPYVPFDETEIKDTRFTIPMLGSYVPKGWVQVESLFCDTSGVGTDNEPAMTLNQLKSKMLEYAKKKGTYGYGITEEGQFQCHVGVFEKEKQ
jgi:hypothetical protein